MIKLEIYDAVCSETVEELFYDSEARMCADFKRIEKKYSTTYNFSDGITAKIELRGKTGELK